jgi:hypothetical protein
MTLTPQTIRTVSTVRDRTWGNEVQTGLTLLHEHDEEGRLSGSSISSNGEKLLQNVPTLSLALLHLE